MGSEEVPQGEIDYSSKSVDELKAIAKSKGLSGYSSMKKSEIIELISKG